jgi:hypothetical protein
VAQRNDQVFQLSLTEIAFTVAFILLLLLGYLVFKEESLRKAAEAELAKVQSAEGATAALDAARAAIKATLQGTGVGSPDEVITKLIAVEDVRAERDRLKKRVEDLDAKLTALEELRKRLEEAGRTGRPDVTSDEVTTALALQDQVRKALEDAESAPPAVPSSAVQPGSKPASVAASASAAALAAASTKTLDAAKQATKSAEAASYPIDAGSSASRARRDAEALAKVRQAIAATGELKKQLRAQLNRDLPSGQEAQTVREVVSAAKGYVDLARAGANPEQIKRENSDLRGQVAFLKNRLDARGGRDFPPCWADEDGKVEFLFSVELKPDTVVLTPAWPPRRETAARALPGMAELLTGPHSNQDFVKRIQGIFNWSRQQDPECRHYVQLRSSIADAVQSDRARLLVERFFYKTEVRR